MNHPSFFELDAWALGATPSKELRAHVDDCSECLAHMARVAPDHGSLPLWTQQLDVILPNVRRARRPSPWFGAAAFVAAGGVVLVVRLNGPGTSPAQSPQVVDSGDRAHQESPEPPSVQAHEIVLPSPDSPVVKSVPRRSQDPPVNRGSGRPEHGLEREYLASKGAPHVKIVIKRSEALFVWQDQQAIQSGDRFMLHVAPAGYREVCVLGSVRGRFGTLYQGKVPEDGPLPKAWEIDEEGAAERLIVVLSDAQLSPDELEGAVAGKPLGQRLWMHEVVLPKLGARP